jgi:hypothetical protein
MTPFVTRGIVLRTTDLQSLDWPARAARAGLSTIGTHVFPHEVADFAQSDAGHSFLAECRSLGIQVEHELHAMSDLLPRDLFGVDPAMFPMNDDGVRVPDYNLCVHSLAALEIVAQTAERFTRLLPSTTGRYFYWPDDGQPMCRCPRCRSLSDSDQALIVENHILAAIRRADPRATLAHLAYVTTLAPPSNVRPADGIFLEFAPITRLYDRPLRVRDAHQPGYPGHGELLDYLDANLAVFPRDSAQILEYWTDASHFSEWEPRNVRPVPWNEAVFQDDLHTYAQRGIRHITSFGVWLDADYVRRHGEPPVALYAQGLLSYPDPNPS